MTTFLTLAGIVILATVAVGIWRNLRGARDAERMMAAQLLGSGGVAVLLLSSVISGIPAIIDVALIDCDPGGLRLGCLRAGSVPVRA